MRLNTLLTSFALLSGWYLLTSTIKDPNNPPVARTGAPGESTCAASGCHNGGAYTGSVTMSGVPDTVVANTTYSVTVTTSSNAVRSGYQLTCLDGNNSKCGTLTSATGTSIGTNNATGRQYARQSTPKTMSNGAASWTFSWKAPASASGNTAKFYFVALAANGNGNKSGDNLFSANSTKTFVTAVSAVSTPEATANVKVYPSVATEILNVELNDANSGVVKIINLQGRVCATYTLQAGKNTIPVASLPGGYYIARIEAEGKTAVKRFVR